MTDDRPARQQVEHWLERYPQDTLAREVRALREELEVARVERDGANERARMMLEQKNRFRAENERLTADFHDADQAAIARTAIIVRVAALCNEWEAEGSEPYTTCAAYLRAALRDEP